MTADHDAALAWAAEARRRRHEVVAGLAHGTQSLPDVLAAGAGGGDPFVAAIKLVVVVQAVPGLGKVASRRLLAALGLEDRRVGELSGADRLRVSEEVVIRIARPAG